jgi:hypothetical protein
LSVLQLHVPPKSTFGVLLAIVAARDRPNEEDAGLEPQVWVDRSLPPTLEDASMT